jgi:hypothetical protein
MKKTPECNILVLQNPDKELRALLPTSLGKPIGDQNALKICCRIPLAWHAAHRIDRSSSYATNTILHPKPQNALFAME